MPRTPPKVALDTLVVYGWVSTAEAYDWVCIKIFRVKLIRLFPFAVESLWPKAFGRPKAVFSLLRPRKKLF